LTGHHEPTFAVITQTAAGRIGITERKMFKIRPHRDRQDIPEEGELEEEQ